ncbi:MAG: hypothetical protein WKF57_03795 [Nakamurella sp.]
MANPQKAKGDKAEREAVLVFQQLVPELLCPDPMRKLGAGRKHDVGDLDVLTDAVVQVKSWNAVGAAVRSGALGAQQQAANARLHLHTGMVKIPGVRGAGVRWVAATTSWPGGRPADDELALFALVPAALNHVRRDNLGVPRIRRVAAVRYAGTPEILVAPIEAWLHAYRSVVEGRCPSCGLGTEHVAAHVPGEPPAIALAG